MPTTSAQVTAAEISRLAGVTRATVSNWRRRHPDFPTPAGGTETSPLYDLESVRGWLAARGHTHASAGEELRAALRLRGSRAASRALPLVLAAGRDKALRDSLDELTDTALVTRARLALAKLADSVPRAEAITYELSDADVLRALARCLRDEGPHAALGVLAERELDDSSAGGAYPTPTPLAELMARLVDPADGSYPRRVLDPACGSGALLSAAATQGATELYAQDVLTVQAQQTAIRVRLAAPSADVTARVGDSLRADAFAELTADAVLSNPPYGDRDWGHDELAYDPRWAYGVPPRAESELAWTQHALAHLTPGGHAVLLLPPATASRSSGRRVRAELVRTGAVRAVMALPAGAAMPLHIGLHLWILRRPAGAGDEHKTVLFADLSDAARATERTQTGQGAIDWETLTTKACQTWQRYRTDPESFTDERGVARAVPLVDLLDELGDLTPARHVRRAPDAADPGEIAARATEQLDQLRDSIADLARTAELGSWPPVGDTANSWRTATVADLARGGALAVLRATPATRADDAQRPVTNTSRAVLTVEDVVRGARASREAEDAEEVRPVIAVGDVLLPRVIGTTGRGAARVADKHDAGSLLDSGLILVRPDQQRLDPWFLAGFLAAEDNVSGATTGTLRSHIQVDPKRLRVPLLPLAEQRRYGAAFQRLHAVRLAAREAGEQATETMALLTHGLTGGALLPPDGTSGPEPTDSAGHFGRTRHKA
jgi:hypothetical protein